MTKERSITVKVIARVIVGLGSVLIPVLFGYARAEEVRWLEYTLCGILWLFTIVGALSLAQYLWIDSLEWLAFRVKQRRLGWLHYIGCGATVVLVAQAGWHLLAISYTIVLVLGIVLRVLGQERLSQLEGAIARETPMKE